jgi:hypothetical protein
MDYQEIKILKSEKRKLYNILKIYNNEQNCYCLAAEVIVKRIIKIEELLK